MHLPQPASIPGTRQDVVVAGGGIVGLATALAICKGTRLPCRIAVRDAALATPPGPPTLRAVAVAAGVRRFLHRLGVWDSVEAGAQPIRRMVITDSRVGALPPPAFLDFGDDAAPGEPFAHMVLHDPLHAALRAACGAAGVSLEGRGVQGFAADGEAVRLDPGLPGETEARLLVAADGARSRLRDVAGLRTVGRDYGQSGIVATLRHAEPHGGVATQHFLPGGPLALLPLRDAEGGERRTSIVWTEGRREAERLAALAPEAFVAALEVRVGGALGSTVLEDRPRAIPLMVRLARDFVAPRVALAGDAARAIHPLAGQGLNLGLRDADALGTAVAEALELGLDPGSPVTLGRYQRARRPDSVAMAATTHLLNRLFSNDSGPVRLLRDVGLGLVDRSPALKRFLIGEAAGGVSADEGGPRD